MRMSAIFVALVIAAWIIFLLVGSYAGRHLSVGDYESRFPERSTSYDAAELGTFASSQKYAAEFYVTPILVPLDLIVMILLAGSMAAASHYWLQQFNFPIPWIALLLPAIYLVTDFVEDNLLAGYLLKPDTITSARVELLQWLTWLKIRAVIGAAVQTVAIFAIFLISHLPYFQRS
jgi:hypothetical protein